jgi:hypothetical protein
MPVVIEGVVGLRKALNKLAPDIKKEMDKEVREALKPIIADARSKVPGSAPGGLFNWNDPGYVRKSIIGKKEGFPSFNQQIIRRGLTYSLGTKRFSGTGFVSLFTLLNKSRVGAIIETAGRTGAPNPRSQSNNPNAGERFTGAMNGIGPLRDYAGRGQKSTGRLLYAAYARNQGKAVNATLAAIDTAKNKFYQRIRASRGEAA